MPHQVQDVLSRSAHISSKPSDDVGIAAHLFRVSVELLRISRSSIQMTSGGSPNCQRALSRIIQSLWLWGDSHDIFSGQLDTTLQRSKRLQLLIVKILRSILQRVSHRKYAFRYPENIANWNCRTSARIASA
jgi:hypothetical protein